MRQLALISALLLAMEAATFSQTTTPSFDFRVTNAATAIKIAKAALEQDFGQEGMRKLKSFEAVLVGDKWLVYARRYKLKPDKPNPHGGTYDVEIAVERGSVLSIKAEM